MSVKEILNNLTHLAETRREHRLIVRFVTDFNKEREIYGKRRIVLQAIIDGYETRMKIAQHCKLPPRTVVYILNILLTRRLIEQRRSATQITKPHFVYTATPEAVALLSDAS
jgi:hypothetical protein